MVYLLPMISCDSLESYLRELKGLSSQDIQAVKAIDLALLVWRQLKEIAKNAGNILAVPDACLGENQNLMLLWDNEHHCFECEIFSSGVVEFFYRSRLTNELWGIDTTLELGFCQKIVDTCSMFEL